MIPSEGPAQRPPVSSKGSAISELTGRVGVVATWTTQVCGSAAELRDRDRVWGAAFPARVSKQPSLIVSPAQLHSTGHASHLCNPAHAGNPRVMHRSRLSTSPQASQATQDGLGSAHECLVIVTDPSWPGPPSGIADRRTPSGLGCTPP